MSYVLHAEPTIRIILTACRLAASLRTDSESRSTLPIFDFWLSSLRNAVDEDPFWGPAFWKELEPRASNLETGIQQMVRQCIEFEGIRSDQSAARPEPPSVSVGVPVFPAKLGTFKSNGTTIGFVSEETRWMQRIVLGCWTSLLADAANVGHASRNWAAVPPPLSRLSSS